MASYEQNKNKKIQRKKWKKCGTLSVTMTIHI